MHWFIDPIKNHYADFKGRASRQEYWMFALVYFLVVFIGIIVAGGLSFLFSLNSAEDSMAPFFIVFGVLMLFVLAVTIPQLALQVRRLHDINRSGWWYLVALVPYIGGFVMLIMSCIAGKPGINKWGPNPYGIGIEPTPEPVTESAAETSEKAR